jgi:broad specificity phosphatase PhoE
MTIFLVRHPPVVTAWQKRCYGQSDPGLSRHGQSMIAPLVAELASLQPDVVVHSGMRRTRAVAEALARSVGVRCIEEPLWRERDFGQWEGKTWNAVYRASGNAMDGMIDAPTVFRPGATGETTAELVQRVRLALSQIKRGTITVIVSHGGPIAAARMHVRKQPYDQLPQLILGPGTYCRLDETVDKP